MSPDNAGDVTRETKRGRTHSAAVLPVRGFSLLEALIALLLLCVGALAATQLSMAMQHSMELAYQRAHAVRLAQSLLDDLRRRARAPGSSEGSDGYESIATQPPEEYAAASAPVRFLVGRYVQTHSLPRYKSIVQSVEWTDSRHQPQVLVLRTVIVPRPSGWAAAQALATHAAQGNATP